MHATRSGLHYSPQPYLDDTVGWTFVPGSLTSPCPDCRLPVIPGALLDHYRRLNRVHGTNPTETFFVVFVSRGRLS